MRLCVGAATSSWPRPSALRRFMKLSSNLAGRFGGAVPARSIGREVWMVMRARQPLCRLAPPCARWSGLFVVEDAGHGGHRRDARSRPQPLSADPHARHNQAIAHRRRCFMSRHAAMRGEISRTFNLAAPSRMCEFRSRHFPRNSLSTGGCARPFRGDDHPSTRLWSAPTSRWTRPSCYRRPSCSVLAKKEPQIALSGDGGRRQAARL